MIVVVVVAVILLVVIVLLVLLLIVVVGVVFEELEIVGVSFAAFSLLFICLIITLPLIEISI